ncbi:hypothetical protein M408DRAFT_75384 [Serendipita vermifera MAFF 305830]|uniref:F-box domain-containing protein n=1 Tax=Serendipita vermifera MAFF 305830 TaxID=933852 RepID=A0A0C2WE94_SERVB|nr:hypothetical protein M408DRAFT_75384 [Serendipita vermifera MAFF 305830]
MSRPIRGQKHSANYGVHVGLHTGLQCYLFQLPNELLAELAMWLSHPVDLLSLAMSSKHLYNRLTGSNASLIWQRTRAMFQPDPVPDPPGDLTEVAWATFLFGPHPCHTCGRRTFDPPFSFVHRLHLCKVCTTFEL